MKNLSKIFSIYYIAGAILMSSAYAGAQAVQADEIIYIEPLFEYPVAPDNLESLNEKSEYLVTHFWNNMNFQNKAAVDQNALNDAFQVFISPMRWSRPEITDNAINAYIKKIAKNPTLLIQSVRAAEEALYGPRAVYWSDEAYLKFVEALLDNKKIPEYRKERYERHKRVLNNSRLGSAPSIFTYTTPIGDIARYIPDGVITVIEFGDPACDDCRYAKLKMETDIKFSTLVDKGIINVLFILPDAEEGWQTEIVGLSPKWHVGYAEDISDIMDIRILPSFYVIDRNGKIAAKNVNYKQAMAKAIEIAEN